MNREIKFRVWDESNKQWTDNPNIPLNFTQNVEKKFQEILIPQQFTGLKDKNNKEIYEGDIVKGKRGYLREIEWNNTKAGYTGIEWEDYNDKVLEIIGNIFENKELLK